jgi:glutathionylspermidine synthase
LLRNSLNTVSDGIFADLWLKSKQALKLPRKASIFLHNALREALNGECDSIKTETQFAGIWMKVMASQGPDDIN